jgi:superfamily II DNA or RNA helicase
VAVVGRIPLRYCQIEDANAITHAVSSGRRRPACVAATGYGKGALVAEMAGRLTLGGTGKVLVLLDRSHLVHQLADEIERHLDVTCGRVADGVCDGINRRIVVSTVQAQFTPDRERRPLYEYPQFRDVGAVIIDEGHKFFADRFRRVADHFSDSCAAIIGFTATPVASNGDAWESFFDWTAKAEGPAMRTVPWCVRNGYLVPPKQVFVRVELDLSEIHERLVRGEEDPDDEDTGDELSGLLIDLLSKNAERAAATFAAGVADVIGRRRAIIFAPPRVTAAKLLAAWLNATGRVDL